jgi:hypothetical protein
MNANRLLRGNQKEKKVCRLAVHRVEIDSSPTAPEGDHQVFDFLQLAMRDGNPIANPCTAEAFALLQHPDHFIAVKAVLNPQHGIRQLGQHLALSRRLQVGSDGGWIQQV